MMRITGVFAGLLMGVGLSIASAHAEDVARTENVTVRAGQTQRIAFYPAAKKDCSRTPLPEINLLDEPRNGRLTVRRVSIVAAPNSVCPGQNIPGVLVLFTAKAGFIGQDKARYAVRLSGRNATVQLNIRVIGGGNRGPRDMIDI